jgi:hypothetical protein
MTAPQADKLKSLEALKAEICGLRPRLAELIPEFRRRIEVAEKAQEPRLEQTPAPIGGWSLSWIHSSDFAFSLTQGLEYSSTKNHAERHSQAAGHNLSQ